MELIKASRDAILKPLQTVTGIVEKRHTLPILSNVLLSKEGETVSFLATDVEIQIQTSASLSTSKDSTKVTVSAKKLLDVLRSLPDSNEIAINLTSKKATIQSGKSRFALQTLSADDFPTVSVNSAFVASFALEQKQLKQLFQMVHFAMAQQDIRYYLNGLLLVTDGQLVRVVATDGHRLAYCQAEVSTSLAKQEVILPRKTVLELQKLLGDTDEPVHIDVAANQARFKFNDVEMISKLVEGKFPDFQRVIPNGYTKHITLGRDAFAATLARVSIMTTDKFKGVRLSLADSVMKIQSSNAEQEEAADEIDVDYAGDAIDIGFNVSYLQDVLGNLKNDQVQLSFGDANTSALLTLPNDDSFKYVVMPMRI